MFAAPDAGLLSAVIIAAGVTALVAVVMTTVLLRRTDRLGTLRGIASIGIGLGVVAVSTVGVVALSPTSMSSAQETAVGYVVADPGAELPTLSLND